MTTSVHTANHQFQVRDITARLEEHERSPGHSLRMWGVVFLGGFGGWLGIIIYMIWEYWF